MERESRTWGSNEGILSKVYRNGSYKRYYLIDKVDAKGKDKVLLNILVVQSMYFSIVKIHVADSVEDAMKYADDDINHIKAAYKALEDELY